MLTVLRKSGGWAGGQRGGEHDGAQNSGEDNAKLILFIFVLHAVAFLDRVNVVSRLCR